MVDINCDMGEGMPNDALIMPFISSANIACGYHAGTEATILQTVELCLKHGVAVGAHPSFNDRQNFGRTEMRLSDVELHDLISLQLDNFASFCLGMGAEFHHVKPHGALYNMAAKDKHLAAVIAKAIFSFNSSLKLYGLANSFLVSEGTAIGLKTTSEAFADRGYLADGSLTNRSEACALLTKEEDVVKQVLMLVKENAVIAVNGNKIPVKADTICIHSDGEHAPGFAKAIFEAMKENGILISAG